MTQVTKYQVHEKKRVKSHLVRRREEEENKSEGKKRNYHYLRTTIHNTKYN